MTNNQVLLIAAAILTASGVVGFALGFISEGVWGGGGAVGAVPGFLAMILGVAMGVSAMKGMQTPRQ